MLKEVVIGGLFIGMMFAAVVASANEMDASGVIRSPTGNHCLDQLMTGLKNKFGKDIKFGSVFLDPNCETSYIWIRTNLCSGHFVGVLPSASSCTAAHYGRVPQYVRRIWAHGDCKRLMPRDVYL